jgi:starch synthase (maltosyl-transferring)
LHTDWTLRFLPIDNEQLIAYAKATEDLKDIVVVVANLDPYNAHSGWVELPLADWVIDPLQPYRMDDLLGGGSYEWRGARNFVRLDPHGVVAHVFALRAPDTIKP